MILSRTMREYDYDGLVEQGTLIQQVHQAIKMWYPYQHHHRLWEYSMATKALMDKFGIRRELTISDHGCGAGYLGPIMSWLGHRVWLYECWTWGDESKYMLEQMQRVATARGEWAGSYELRSRPLGGLVEEDKGVDAAFCISTLEHIGNYQAAFRDLLGTVKPGGLCFITTDFGEHELDDYPCASLRAGKMYTVRTYQELLAIAQEMGFKLMGGECDWRWGEECRLVTTYGFASMALEKEN